MATGLRVSVITTTESAESIAGAGIVMRLWRQALLARGNRVELITCPETPPPGPPEGGAARLRAACAAFTGELVRRWTADRPEIVHVELAGNVGLAALDAADRLGMPTTSNFHHMHLYAAPGSEPRIMGLLAMFHRRCRMTMAEQEASARLLAAMGVPDVTVIGRGIDAEDFHPRWRDQALRAQWGAAESDPVILWVGRVIATKDPPAFAAACEQARAANPRVRAVVVGDGAERAAMAQALPWATYAGVLEGGPLRRAYASADIFAFPSPAEPWGNVLLEAAASGLAIAARSGGAVHEVLAPAGACVVPAPRDRDGLIRAVVALAGDPQLRGQLAAKARTTAEGRTWDAVAAAWEDVWRRLLAAPR